MSKKKSFSGSTMTLKDFHGGSIPSDLPLPSAPGVPVRPPPERPSAWGARGDHIIGGGARARPGSAGSARAALDDRASPFLPIHSHVGRHFDEDERKPLETSSAAALPRRGAPTVARPISAGSTQPSAWAPPHAAAAPQHAAWTPAPLTASKLFQASAADKVASGRWQSKPDVEVIRYQETEVLERRFSESVRIGFNGEKEKNSATSPKHFDRRDDAPERSKLKLLPRRRPLEAPEIPPLVEEKQVQVHQLNLEPAHTLTAPLVVDSTNTSGSGYVGSDGGSRPVERPRLNMKPRSQPLEQSEENSERARNSLFGGARPRELVLKERCIDPANQLDATVRTDRAKHDLPKSESNQNGITPTGGPIERAESFVPEQRSGKDYARKGHRSVQDKMDNRGSLWRNEQKKNPRELEKQQEPRRPEPDTWRKPIEEPKPDAHGPHLGKGVSALQLAQAFSRSVSDNQQGLPGRPQVPFSRLTETRQRYSGRVQRKINGLIF